MSLLTGLRWLLSRPSAQIQATQLQMEVAAAARPALFPPNAELMTAGGAENVARPTTARVYPASSPPRAEGSKAEKAKLSRGYRNKNPGNIDFLPAGRAWNGQVGKDLGGRFGIYDTHEHGIRAIGKQLRKYQESYDLHTIRAIINQWAPPVENATSNYIARVDTAMTRHGADDRLDLSDYLQLRVLVEAIITVECDGNPYQPDMIDRGVRLALA